MRALIEPRRDGLPFRLGALGALCIALGGCGSDVVVAEQAHRNDAARAADAGHPEAGKVGGEESDGGFLPNFTVCGSERCTDRLVELPGVGRFPAYACCVAHPASSACGVVEGTQCAELDYPGRVDSSCMSVGPLQGCCRKDNTCGVLDTKYGFGCAQIPFISGLVSCTY